MASLIDFVQNSQLSKLTKEFREVAYSECAYCGAEPDEMEIRYFSAIFNDAQVWCSICNVYLKVWDF